jgi:hypothetical protein
MRVMRRMERGKGKKERICRFDGWIDANDTNEQPMNLNVLPV